MDVLLYKLNGDLPAPGRDLLSPLGKKIPLPEVKEEVYVYTIILSSRYEQP
jgi:hypothetical protein